MRGQAHALEAVIGSLILLASLLLALQMTVVTPLSASTSSQFIENQQRAAAEGALSAAADVGWLQRAVLYWDDSAGQYHDDTDETGYTGDELPGENGLGDVLDTTFASERIAYNVYLVNKTDGHLERRRYIYSGTPTDKAVIASRTVVITDDDELVNKDGSPSGTTVEGSTFYMDDEHTGNNLFRVVRVQVVVWKN